MRLTKDRKKKALGFDDTWFMIGGIFLLSLLLPLVFFPPPTVTGGTVYLVNFGVSIVYTVAYWSSMRAIFLQLRLRFPSYHDTRKRLGLTVVLALGVYIVLNQALDYLVHDWLRSSENPDEASKVTMNAISLTLIGMVGALYESIFLYGRWRESIVEKEKLEKMHFQSQLEGLKNQVNPHFLFNSLNTLAYLIPEDPEKGVQFVQKLSKVYRYILEIRDTKLISLREELKFLHSYLFLLKERFADNLIVNIDIPEYLKEDKLVPLSLQLLFENAIKHNIISSAKPLHIALYTESDDTLIIRNDLQRKPHPEESTQVGLENIKNRYAFLSERTVEVVETKDYFEVRIPLLKAMVKTE